MTLLASRARGARPVYICDTKDDRLNKASELGAALAINSHIGEFLSRVMDTTNRRGADIAIDCSGTQAGMRSTINPVASGGTVVMMGMPPDDEPLYNLSRLVW